MKTSIFIFLSIFLSVNLYSQTWVSQRKIKCITHENTELCDTTLIKTKFFIDEFESKLTVIENKVEKHYDILNMKDTIISDGEIIRRIRDYHISDGSNKYQQIAFKYRDNNTLYIIFIKEQQQTYYIDIADGLLCYYESEADMTFNQGSYTKAIEYLNKAILIDNSNGYNYLLRGISFFEKNDFQKAVIDLTRAIELTKDVNRSSAWFLKERCMVLFGGKYLKTENNTILEHTYYQPFLIRGVCKFNLEDFRGAILDFDSYLVYEQEDYRPHYFKGMANYNLYNFEKAIDAFTKCIELEPNDMEFFYLRGISYLNNNMINEGCLDLSRAGELGHSDAYNIIKDYCK